LLLSLCEHWHHYSSNDHAQNYFFHLLS
jgi:hypothetical protein